MGERYYITGVQLGVLKAFHEILENRHGKSVITLDVNLVIKRVEEKQFIGRIEEFEKGSVKIGLLRPEKPKINMVGKKDGK